MDKIRPDRCELCLLRSVEPATGVPGFQTNPLKGVWYGCARGSAERPESSSIVSAEGWCNFWEKRRRMWIDRAWSMPCKRTFEMKPIAELLKQEVKFGIWFDPMAGSSRVGNAITNDLNPDFNTRYNMDALEFLKMQRAMSADGVLYDPPYSVRQVKECYESVGIPVTQETTRADFWTKIKAEIVRVLVPGGKCISFGWNSNGIGKTSGFRMKRILMVAHGGIHNDTIVTVEHKMSGIQKEAVGGDSL